MIIRYIAWQASSESWRNEKALGKCCLNMDDRIVGYGYIACIYFFWVWDKVIRIVVFTQDSTKQTSIKMQKKNKKIQSLCGFEYNVIYFKEFIVTFIARNSAAFANNMWIISWSTFGGTLFKNIFTATGDSHCKIT